MMNTLTQPSQIAFVLDNVADYQTLVAGIPAGTLVYVLDATGDVLAQMAGITADYSNLDAIHLLSHGSDGALGLGGLSLNNANVNDYAGVLSQIGSSLSENGDILLYGCNVAQGSSGTEFIGTLAQLTDADIAASDDGTGSSSLGGDWILERVIGDIESAMTIEGFVEILATPADQNFDSVATAGSSTSPIAANGITYSWSGSQSDAQIALDTEANVSGLGVTFAGFSGKAIFTDSLAWNDAEHANKLIVSSTNLSDDFQINSFALVTWTTDPLFTDKVDIIGYQGGTGGTQVASVTGVDLISATSSYGSGNNVISYSQLINNTNAAGGTISFSGSNWGNIDTIVIQTNSTQSTRNLVIAVDSFDFSDPVLPFSAPSTPDLDAASDSGSSSTDNITNDTTPTFTGTSDASVTVNLYDTDGTTLLGTTTADGSGNWSITTSALSAGVHSITAKANNGSTDSAASAALSITIDTTAPTATITMADTALKAGETSLVTITFSEAVVGFTNDDLTIANGTLSAVSSADGGTTWTATFTPSVTTSDTTNVITLDNTALTDVAGNAGVGTTDSANYVVETNSPTDIALSNATASTAGGANAVVGALSSTDATAGDTFTYALVAGAGDTNNGSFNINGSDLRVNDPAALGVGTYSVLVRSTDAAGNTYDEAQSITISTNPTVTITADDASLKSGQTATITFTFSEAPTGFDAADITASGGTLSGLAVTGNPLVYTATFTPTADTANLSGSVSIAAAAFTGSGNDSLASNTLSITGDTLAPTAPTITSAASGSDSTPTLTGTTEANATVTVVIAGATYTTTANGSGGWSVDTGTATPDSGTLAINANGNNSVSVTATDSAGNVSTATAQTLAIDTTAPIFTSAATNSTGTKIILTYDEALSATTAATTDFTVNVEGSPVAVSGVAISGSTVELTLAAAITNGQTVTVAYTAPASNSATTNSAVQDSSGNDAASLTTTTATNSVQAPSSGGSSTPPPTTSTIINEDNLTGVVKTTPVTQTVGNTTVTTQTATATRMYTDDDGETITQTNKTVEAVQITASTSGNTATTAIPLYWGESTQTEWATTASVSSGVTLASEGNRAPSTTQTTASAIDDLIYYIQTTVPSTDSTKSGMLGGGSSFLSGLNNVNTLVVNKVVFSTTSATSTTPSTVSLDGTATAVTTNGVTQTPKEALVIDGSSLSSGSTVSLSNIEFGVLTGANLNVVMTGTATQTVFTGEGIQTLTTSSSTQNQLYAGGGDDTFHVTAPQSNLLASERALSVSISESFADTIDAKTTLYGEDGNDNANVEGSGTLNTFVHGGSGSDSMNYQGSINDYTITHDEGITYVRSNATSKTDILLNVESIQFDDQTYTITNDTQLIQIASLYQEVLGRQAEVDGFQYWAHSYNAGESIGDIATSFVRSSEYFNNTNNAWDSMNNDAKIEVFYQLMLGRASDAEGKSYWMDAINNSILTIEQIAESFVESIEMQGNYLSEQGWNFIA